MCIAVGAKVDVLANCEVDTKTTLSALKLRNDIQVAYCQ